jgi:hypothetical protein
MKDDTDRGQHDTFAALFVDLYGTREALLEGFWFAGFEHLNEDLKNA